MGLASATHRRRHRDILEIIFFSSSPFVFNIQEKTKSLHSLHLTIHNTDLLTCVLSSTLSLLTLPRDILIHNVDGTTYLDYLVSAVTDVTSDCPRWRGRGTEGGGADEHAFNGNERHERHDATPNTRVRNSINY